MPRKWLFGFILFSLFPLHSTLAAEVQISFYSESIAIQYDEDIRLEKSVSVNEKLMIQYYRELLKTNFQLLLSELETKKQLLGLNDWLYYELMRKAIDVIMVDEPALKKDLSCWFLLSESGYDTRLTFLNNQTYLYVYTQDELFEVPMIKENGRIYVNLTSIHQGSKSQKALYLLEFIPRPEGKAFGFYLNELPKLKPQLSTKAYQFNYEEQVYSLKINIDQTIRDLMADYPFFAEKEYLEVPLSMTLNHSIIPQFKQLIASKTKVEALELLVSFTRSSFQYKDDKDFFGRSKPMIADEVFHYEFSDCEDRSALFYSLVKSLLDLPMVVVAFPDHLTIAVAVPDHQGDHFIFNEKKYFFCDPTGPVNSTTIGKIPSGYENTPFEIIGSYR